MKSKFTDTVKLPKERALGGMLFETEDRFSNLRGEVKAIVTLDSGESFVAFEDKNLIVNGAKTVLSRLLGEYPATNDWQVTEFQMGTQGNVPGDILVPVDPSVINTSLVDPSPFIKKFRDNGVCSIDPETNYNETLCTTALGSWTADPLAVQFLPLGNETSVQFTTQMTKNEGNGTGLVTYTEAGLFTENGTMFARKTFPALIKSNDRQITFIWTILF